MRNQLLAVLACTVVVGLARAESFVIPAQQAGHEATVRIPGSAVTELSADFAETLVDRADSQVEVLRLTGDVLISVAGSAEPIHIKADRLVLTLIPDSARTLDPASGRPNRAATATLPGDDDAEVLVGDVVFSLNTSAGPMQIKADRLEHRLRAGEPGAKAAS